MILMVRKGTVPNNSRGPESSRQPGRLVFRVIHLPMQWILLVTYVSFTLTSSGHATTAYNPKI